MNIYKKLLILSILSIGTIIGITTYIFRVLKPDINTMVEKAYFEGQKDAIQGDIRIKQINDTSYIWIKSPWDSGSNPIYKPNN